jgi:hypothetical protein
VLASHRVRTVLVAVVVLAVARSAYADDVDDLVAQGESLAKQAEWSRAIDAFKAADAKRPRAKHACLIGLAYTRRELWAEAELFVSICKQRATADDPMPDWAEEAQRTLSAKLAASNADAIAITVTPPTALAMVNVSSFAPGETFTPRTIHLAPGTHVITVTAPGYKPSKRDITVTGNNSQQHIEVRLEPEHVAAPPSQIPLYIAIVGGALLASAIAYDELVVQPAFDDLRNNDTALGYYTQLPDVDRKRHIAMGLFAAGGITVVTGLVLRLTVLRHREAAVTVGAAPRPGGGIMTLEWSR